MRKIGWMTLVVIMLGLLAPAAKAALSSNQVFPSYANMWPQTQRDLTRAVPGDVLTTDPATLPHTAIVVEIKRDSSGNVYGLDVIDSNWVSDGGGNREMIGRHLFLLSNIQGRFGIWNQVSYYQEPYIP